MAAPKGNQFAKGLTTSGRPPKHTDPEVVRKLVEEYFTTLPANIPPTVTGLTLHLGFAHKDSLYEYAKKDVFTDSIRRGLTLIEQYHEIKASQGDKCTGNIFILKNFGWKDTVDSNVSMKAKVNTVNRIDISLLNDEDLDRLEYITNKARDISGEGEEEV